MKRQLAFGILILTLASLACRISITPTPMPTQPPTITPTITLTPAPTPTETPTPTATPALSTYGGPALIGFQMFDNLRGWGLTESQILITRQGGNNWAQVPLPGIPYNPAIQAYFIDINIAYFFVPGAASQAGQFLATRDGGATWQTSVTPFDNAKLYFPDDNNGFALQTLSTDNEQMSITLYQTLDRGKTWQQNFTHAIDQGDKKLPATGIKTGMSFIDPSQGFMGLRDQKNDIGLYHTEDSGRTWVKQELTLPDQIGDDYQSTVWPPFFFRHNDKDGFLPVDFVSGASGTPTRVFYITNDAGMTWQKGGEIPDGSIYYFIDPQAGWAWGERTVYTTTDGAKTWQPSPVTFNRSERGKIIDFVDQKNGWLITVDAKNVLHIYRTYDGGATWTAIS